ncbi:histidine phosphatase family protein [Subtercola boreus]|uniref:Histidine phosphatase family protein n=1 Tax=Subtercola boreus TaxID=120213 RepID=A0A3E0WAD1_9MICO|nr:histidine phosphatase family protein [Subtercola boreus]RFA20828.1 histidine phosphatase family protein [Subtercola boreus]RFA20943.1 histidine phosphatase family protein [Subtercola boreus]RFA27136.1 histidine phosphatase family protein [Subtercola boreus]
MTVLHLARHGETVWHSENRYAGSSDIALTPKGVGQSQALARWAEAHGVTDIHTSDLQRAIQTARPSADALGLQLHQDARLREVHFGAGEGLTTEEMRVSFPGALQSYRRAPATSPLPTAESGQHAVDRAWPALHEIAGRRDGREPGNAHPERVALIVMHSTLLRLILCQTLGIPLDAYRTAFPTVINVAITTISLPRDGRSGGSLLAYNTPV